MIGSSPAPDVYKRQVSHHMQILKDAGIVKSRKEGTCIYYYLDPEAGQLNNLITLFCDIREFMKYVSDRSGNDT